MNTSEYPPPDEGYESSYEYEEPVVSEPPPPPPPPVEPPPPEPPPPPPPVEPPAPPPEPPAPPPEPPAAPPEPPAAPVEQAPPPPPVEQAPPEPAPSVEEPRPPAEQVQAPPSEPPEGADDLPPDLPTQHDAPDAAVEDSGSGDAADVMRPGQPGAESMPADEAPVVEPSWASEGDGPFPVSQRDIPLDSIVGPGQPYELRWNDQGSTDYCAICCAQTIVSELSGRSVDEEELVARAADAGSLAFDASGDVRGTPVAALGDVLSSYGIDSHTTTGEADARQRLDEALRADRRVILPLDQPDYGQHGQDVSLAVTGIDDARGLVLARDSAQGSPVQIPLDVLENSWRASDFAMISVEDAPYDVLGMTLHPQLGPSTSALPLDGMPVGGQAALGDWWASADNPAGCCAPPDEPAETSLVFTDQTGNVHQLAGVDTTGTGVADTVTLDANQDGRPDTWMFDTTGTGQADLLYYDSTGSGQPDSVSCCADDGEWTDPLPLTTALNQTLPDQQPGTPIVVQQSLMPEVAERFPGLVTSSDQLPDSIASVVSGGPDPGANFVVGGPEPATGDTNFVIGGPEPATGDTNFVIGGPEPATSGTNFVIGGPEPATSGTNFVVGGPDAEGQGTLVILPSIMAPSGDQANALSERWGNHWATPDPYLVDLMNSVTSGPRTPVGFTDVAMLRNSLQRFYASQSIIGTAMMMPEGIERRYNPLTGSTIDVPRGSTFP